MNKLAYLRGYMEKRSGAWSNFGNSALDILTAKQLRESLAEGSKLREHELIRNLFGKFDLPDYVGTVVAKKGPNEFDLTHMGEGNRVIRYKGARRDQLTPKMREVIRDLKEGDIGKAVPGPQSEPLLSQEQLRSRMRKVKNLRNEGLLLTGGTYGGIATLGALGTTLAAS